MADVEIRGLREAQRALYAYSQQLGDRVVVASLRQGANLVLRQARVNAPKRTGALRRGLVVKKSRLYRGQRGTLGVYLSLRRGKGRRDPRDAFYGRWVESGWTARNGQPVAGRRFVARAFQAQQAAAANLIARSAIQGADIVARRTRLK